MINCLFFLIVMLKLRIALALSYKLPYNYVRFHSSKTSFYNFHSKEMTQMHTSTQNDQSFWSQGLKFSCTGCGKCCQTEGEVWFDSEEFCDLVEHLQIPVEEVIHKYIDKVISGWIKVKDSVSINKNSGTTLNQCIFLSQDGRQCTIYEVRPQQCRTYPYWPRLLASELNWLNEAVLPEDSPLRTPDSKSWSPENGGCEGINNDHNDNNDGSNKEKGLLVPSNEINIQMNVYEKYHSTFPYVETGDDKSRLIPRVDVIQRVKSATKEWLTSFAIKYGMVSPLPLLSYQYRVYLGSDSRMILNRLELEAFLLLSRRKAELNPATMLVLPFSFPNYQDFQKFSAHAADNFLPVLQKEVNTGANDFEVEANMIEFTFFHPAFACPDLKEKDPRNFVSRSPFPTIQINLKKGLKITDQKSDSLLKSTSYTLLLAEFSAILTKATR